MLQGQASGSALMAINPQTAAFLAQLAAGVDPEAPVPPLAPETSRAGYLAMASVFGVGPDLARVKNDTIHNETIAIPIRIYQSTTEPNQPCVLYFHGGGWVIGDLDTHDKECRFLAAKIGCTVISTHYRLAPEHPFPAGHDDCLAVLRHVYHQGQVLGIDTSRIAVAGDSAGGGIAAFLAIHARDEGIPLARQVLMYPVTDTRSYLAGQQTFAYSSISENAAGPVLTLETMQFFVTETTRNQNAEAAANNWRLSPIVAEDLTGLAPAMVATCELDPLRDEGNAYAKRLEDAGNSVLHKEWPGQPHVLLQMATVIDDGMALMDWVCETLRRDFFGAPS